MTSANAPILVVSERASGAHLYDQWLAWIEASRPILRRAIRLARVPGATAGSARVLHAWVQDPVRERDKRLFDRLRVLEDSILARGGRVINPALALSHSLRDVMMQRLEGLGLQLRLPKVWRISSDVRDFSLPASIKSIIVRPRWGHGTTMELLSDSDAWTAWRERARGDKREWVATEFIDVRSTDALYRKYRYVVFGRHGLARHLIVSRQWEVRPKDRILTHSTKHEELAFVHGDTPYAGMLVQAREALRFDVAAFDFSYDASGNLVLWEVNPYPMLSTPQTAASAYLREVVQATYAKFADFFEECLEATA